MLQEWKIYAPDSFCLRSPAGAIYLYSLLHKLSSHFPKAMAALPLAIYCMILVLTGYLMRRSRLPAPFLLAFVFPVAFFLQGTLISFPLPELFAVLGLLCSLATLSGGLYCLSIACTTLTLSVDVSLMGPLLPALWLCYLRALGFRKSLICSGVGLLVWIVVSAPYILANPAAYFMQVSASDGSSWNPMYWFLEFLGRKYHLSPVSSEGLRAVVSNPWAKTIKVGVLYGLWTQYRWLRSDGGFIAFVNKYAAWQRGHGIRPNPWTPREAMTVVTEALLLMLLVKSPNLIFAGDFPALTVSLALIWGVALAYPLPVPAIFGVLGLMAFLLSFLVRDLVPFIEDDLQFHVHLPRSLHFLPLVLLPLLEVAVLLLAPRELSRARTTAASASPVMPATTSKHVSGGASISHPPPSTSSLVRNVHSREHHRRSLSQSRR
jgi:hypothetical protein